MPVNIFEHDVSRIILKLNEDDTMFLLDILIAAIDNPNYEDSDSQESIRKMIKKLNWEISMKNLRENK